MIDDDGYRPNVGIVICNRQGEVLWARRYGQHSWQFPQGGINPGETPEQAMYRELFEEVGEGLYTENITFISRSVVQSNKYDCKISKRQNTVMTPCLS